LSTTNPSLEAEERQMLDALADQGSYIGPVSEDGHPLADDQAPPQEAAAPAPVVDAGAPAPAPDVRTCCSACTRTQCGAPAPAPTEAPAAAAAAPAPTAAPAPAEPQGDPRAALRHATAQREAPGEESRAKDARIAELEEQLKKTGADTEARTSTASDMTTRSWPNWKKTSRCRRRSCARSASCARRSSTAAPAPSAGPASTEWQAPTFEPEVQDVIDQVPQLQAWQFSQADQDKFQLAATFDDALRKDPTWANKPAVERFAEATKRAVVYLSAQPPAPSPAPAAAASPAAPRKNPDEVIAAAGPSACGHQRLPRRGTRSRSRDRLPASHRRPNPRLAARHRALRDRGSTDLLRRNLNVRYFRSAR
jgi:hypothetical protein